MHVCHIHQWDDVRVECQKKVGAKALCIYETSEVSIAG